MPLFPTFLLACILMLHIPLNGIGQNASISLDFPMDEQEFRSGKISVPITGKPFVALTPIIAGMQRADWEFSIREKVNGKWSDWTPVEKDQHAPRSIGWKGNLNFLNAETKKIQIRIRFHSRFPGIGKLELRFFKPNMSNGGQPTTQSSFAGERGAACPCPMPAFTDRIGWACPDSNNFSGGSPTYTSVSHLIVHHSAGSNSSANWAAVVLAIWNDHVFNNGWSDIGYNYLVDPNGVIYQGRGGLPAAPGSTVLGAHFCGTNGNTMGTCLMGNYMTVQPSAAALNSLGDLLAWKSCDAGLDPLDSSFHSSSQLTLDHISGHQDGCATACPGTQMYLKLPQLRADVANKIALCGQTSPANDSCPSAQPLVLCDPAIPGDIALADSSAIAIPTCQGYTSNEATDVWYSFIPDCSTATVTVLPDSGMDPVIAAYDGNCGNLQFVACVDTGGGPGGLETLLLTGLSPGNSYRVRIYEFMLPGSSTTFDIDVCQPMPPTVLAAANPTAITNGQSSTLTASGATTYTWMPGNLSGSSVIVNPTQTTTYTVTAVDANGCSNVDSVTVTVNPLVSLNEKENDLLQAFPNPNDGTTLFVRWNALNLDSQKIRLVSLLGKELFQIYTTPGESEARLDLHGIPAGVYLLHLRGKTFRIVIR